MCGRYTLTVDERFLRELFDVSIKDLDHAPNYNICPGVEVPVICSGDTEGGRCIRLMRWGLIPKWAKSASIGYKMINARAETVHEKPAYKLPFVRQRCLVPADGFYEWQKAEQGKSPYRITMPEGSLFAFAGLWDRWLTTQGGEIFSFSIITTNACPDVEQIHNRMPVILADNAHWDVWLDMAAPVQTLKKLLVPYGGRLVLNRVSSMVNSPRNNFLELINPVHLDN